MAHTFVSLTLTTFALGAVLGHFLSSFQSRILAMFRSTGLLEETVVSSTINAVSTQQTIIGGQSRNRGFYSRVHKESHLGSLSGPLRGPVGANVLDVDGASNSYVRYLKQGVH